MLITIILTCYKQENFIEETILSVINQKYENRELLIGDDSPDDNCRKIISKYIKKYPDKIRARHHNPNKGIVNNMQFLVEQRSKESGYVAFLEGDDCFFSQYLEYKVNIFTKYPNIQLVYNELTTVDECFNIISEKNLKYRTKSFCRKGKISYEKLITQIYYMSRSTLMVRSEMLDKYQLFSEFLGSKSIISDVYFFNQVAHNEDIYGIEEPLTYYRIHKDSATKNICGSIKFYLEIIKYINYLFEKSFIKLNIYKNQICKYFLVICLLSLKESLNMGMIRTLKIFWEESISRINSIFKRMI